MDIRIKKGATFHQSELKKHYKEMNYAISNYKKIKMTPWRSQLHEIHIEEPTEPTEASSCHLLPSQVNSSRKALSSSEQLFVDRFKEIPKDKHRVQHGSAKKVRSSKRQVLDGYREAIKKYKQRPESNDLMSLTHPHFRMSNFAHDLEKSYQNVESAEESLMDEKPQYDLAARRMLAKKR